MLSDTYNNNLSLSVAKQALLEDVHATGSISKIVVGISPWDPKWWENRVQVEKIPKLSFSQLKLQYSSAVLLSILFLRCQGNIWSIAVSTVVFNVGFVVHWFGAVKRQMCPIIEK